jgi:hypothetical protein
VLWSLALASSTCCGRAGVGGSPGHVEEFAIVEVLFAVIL